MTAIQQIVKNVLDTKYEDFDSATIDHTKTLIIDTIGVMMGGIHSSGVDMALDVVRQWGGREESTILGFGDRVPAPNAVLVMGIAARSNDFEASGGGEIRGRMSPCHNSATTVPTAFAMAEKEGKGPKDLITALILGYDIASRVGQAAPDTMRFGWDPSGTCSRFAATAIAGKLMGLDEDQMLNAMGIVLNMIASTLQSVIDFTHCYKINQGLSGLNGIISAELAKRGFTGPKDPLTSKYGYFNQFCREVDLECLTYNLGKKFYQDEGFKLYPSCHGNVSAIASTLKLIEENDINPEEIMEVTIDLPPHSQGGFNVYPYEITPCPQAGATLNTYYAVANVLLRKDMKVEHYSDAALRDPQIFELTRITKINSSLEEPLTSRVKVKMKDGRELSASTEETRGHIRLAPLTDKEIKDKFMANATVSKVISQESAEKAFKMIERLESLESVTDLINTLIPVKKT